MFLSSVITLSGRFSIRSGARRCGASSRTSDTTGHSSASKTGASSSSQPGNMPPAIDAHDQRHRVRGQEQRQDLHRLRRHREPEQPPVDRDREEAQQRVGERVLAEHGAARARPSAGRRGTATPTPTRRDWCTFQNTSTRARKSGIAGIAAERHDVQREGERAASIQTNSGLTGSSSWSRAARHDHLRAPLPSRPPAFAGAAPARRLAAAPAAAGRSARARARGARRRALPPASAAMRAKPESTLRSTLATLATGRPGG